MKYVYFLITVLGITCITDTYCAEGSLMDGVVTSSPRKRGFDGQKQEENPFAMAAAAALGISREGDKGDGIGELPAHPHKRTSSTGRSRRTVSDSECVVGGALYTKEPARKFTVPQGADMLWIGYSHVLCMFQDSFRGMLPHEEEAGVDGNAGNIKQAHDELTQLSLEYMTINDGLEKVGLDIETVKDDEGKIAELKKEKEKLDAAKNNWIALFTTYRQTCGQVDKLNFLRDITCSAEVPFSRQVSVVEEDKRVSRELWDLYGKLIGELAKHFSQVKVSAIKSITGITYNPVTKFDELAAQFATLNEMSADEFDSVARDKWIGEFEAFKTDLAQTDCEKQFAFMKYTVVSSTKK